MRSLGHAATPILVIMSRRGLVYAALGLLGIACHARDAPDTELPAEQLGPQFRKLRRRIRKHVPSRPRREGALALVDCIEQQLADIDRLLVDWRTDLAVLPDEQRFDRSVILQVTRSYSEQLGDIAREIGRLAFALRRHITADEWLLVFPSPSAEPEQHESC